MERRDFLRAAGVASAAALSPQWLYASARRLTAPGALALHPFVAGHPEAVFIQRTAVGLKTDAEAKFAVGKALGQQLFAPSLSDAGDASGASRFAIKPNLTCLGGAAVDDRLGIVADPDFVEGFVEGLKAGGAAAERIYLREGNLLADAYCPANEALAWYRPLAQRTGAQLTTFDSGRDMTVRGVERDNLEEGSEVIWRDVPGGVIYHRVGYVAPINADDAFNINLAKYKAHGMGLTLTAKNWQGTNIHPYVHYCSSVPGQVGDGLPEADLNPNYRADAVALFQRHLDGGVARWDRPGSARRGLQPDRDIDNWNSGPGMESWAHKTVDNHAASRPGLHLIEGIYSRDGNWMDGPHDGAAADFMTNLVLFGTNPYTVDAIGYWLGGHEPGNVGLLHVAADRGYLGTMNPRAIPVYDWNDGAPILVGVDAFARTPLMTYYLQRDYGGQAEDRWHLLDEPYTYPVITAVAEEGSRPQALALGQNYPNPFNGRTVIEYRLPRPGGVRLEVFDGLGQRVEVLVDGWRSAGAHTVGWDATRRASGTYTYRLVTPGYRQSRRMVLVR